MVNRILIGTELFEFSTEDGLIRQANAKSNCIAVKDLMLIDGGPADNDYLFGYINNANGEIITSLSNDKEYSDILTSNRRAIKSIAEDLDLINCMPFLLPAEIVYQGYDECSEFAKRINAIYPEEYNFRLIDNKIHLLNKLHQPRNLPEVNLEGIDFIVDVANLKVIEKNNVANEINLSDMRDMKTFYVFDFHPTMAYDPSLKDQSRPLLTAIMPELVSLDPIGMAEKYGYLTKDIKGKGDFEVMVDQEAFQKRIKGLLPTITIADHLFYVDLRMNMLRPKDDFRSRGIRFEEISKSYVDKKEAYVIIYDPKRHEHRELDYSKLTEIPTELIVVAIPPEQILDPIGFNRLGGWDEKNGLKTANLKSHFVSEIIDWKETGVQELIEYHMNKRGSKKEQTNEVTRKIRNPRSKGLGRR